MSSVNSGNSNACFSTRTPEILWHGDNSGKPTPVFAVDICPLPPAHASTQSISSTSTSEIHSNSASNSYVLATCGLDGSAPTKGSVRIWHITSDKQEFRVEYSDHQSSVNTIRFSPCGRMLATASDRLIIIYSVSSSEAWSSISDSTPIQRNRINPHLQEIYDIKWSPDSQYVIAGSIDCKAELCRVTTKGDSIPLSGHTSFVQGVAWDPLNEIVVTQSADRSCRTYQIKSRSGSGSAIRVLPRGSTVIKMQDVGPSTPAATGSDAAPASSASLTPAAAVKGNYLFADDTIASFFRRPDFAPDGSLLVAPTGIYRTPAATAPAPGSSSSSGGASASTATEQTATAASAKTLQSFCCHVFARNQLTFPILSYAGLEEPAISVRFSPVLYNWMPSNSPPLLRGKFRFVFAVTTSSSILIYDTQHTNPIVRLAGRHFSNINDSAWSTDGRLLCCCSSDGYITIVRFEPGALGAPLDLSLVPEEVKLSHRCQYGYTNPAEAETTPPAEPGPSDPESKGPEKSASNEIPAPSIDISSPRSEPGGDSGSGGDAAAGNAYSATSASEKKRKRINPTPLGALEATMVLTKAAIANDAFTSGSVTMPSPNSGNPALDSPSVVPPVDVDALPSSSDRGTRDGQSSAPQTDATSAKKAKKRIAPILVS